MSSGALAAKVFSFTERCEVGHQKIEHFIKMHKLVPNELSRRLRTSPVRFAIMPQGFGLRSKSGSLAMFAVIRRASSRVSSLAADLRPGSSSQ